MNYPNTKDVRLLESRPPQMLRELRRRVRARCADAAGILGRGVTVALRAEPEEQTLPPDGKANQPPDRTSKSRQSFSHDLNLSPAFAGRSACRSQTATPPRRARSCAAGGQAEFP